MTEERRGGRGRPKGAKDKKPRKKQRLHPWGQPAVMANGEEVITGTEEHRRLVNERHAAGTPQKTRTIYNQFHAINARKLVALGVGDNEVCDFFGISWRTLYLWMRDHPEFRDAMRMRDEDGVYVDDRVKRSLINRATGYSFHSEKVFHSAEAGVVRVPIVEHVPPDPGSCMFWLKNRLPTEFSDRREVRVDARVAAITATTSDADALALFRSVLQGAVLEIAGPSEEAGMVIDGSELENLVSRQASE